MGRQTVWERNKYLSRRRIRLHHQSNCVLAYSCLLCINKLIKWISAFLPWHRNKYMPNLLAQEGLLYLKYGWRITAQDRLLFPSVSKMLGCLIFLSKITHQMKKNKKILFGEKATRPKRLNTYFKGSLYVSFKSCRCSSPSQKPKLSGIYVRRKIKENVKWEK